MIQGTNTGEPEFAVVELSPRANDERIRNFAEILNKIDALDDKKKQLWREIYENSLQDRQNAYVLFLKLTELCQGKSTEWAVHGRTIVSLQERMSKSVDQMLKLADLVHKAEQSGDVIDPESIYDALET